MHAPDHRHGAACERSAGCFRPPRLATGSKMAWHQECGQSPGGSRHFPPAQRSRNFHHSEEHAWLREQVACSCVGPPKQAAHRGRTSTRSARAVARPGGRLPGGRHPCPRLVRMTAVVDEGVRSRVLPHRRFVFPTLTNPHLSGRGSGCPGEHARSFPSWILG